ncbi:hypothetical protein DBR17_13840 [Sphingomonas sp. HMWF008]|nr:hypothetical protein DBR17_13840 [Sphingomonas sp. HMWF008]
MARIPHDTPTCAAAEHGVVVLDGPDGLATSLTPDAARQSAQHIHRAADLAEQDPDAESP